MVIFLQVTSDQKRTKRKQKIKREPGLQSAKNATKNSLQEARMFLSNGWDVMAASFGSTSKIIVYEYGPA